MNDSLKRGDIDLEVSNLGGLGPASYFTKKSFEYYINFTKYCDTFTVKRFSENWLFHSMEFMDVDLDRQPKGDD